MSTFSPFEIIEGDLNKGLVLLCDHASNFVPDEYGTLGLPAREFERHIAYDIGAQALTRGLAAKLNVPAVISCFSRLLIDPNRGADDPTLVRQLSDGTVIPSNYPLPQVELQKRTDAFFTPYHEAIDAMLDNVKNACRDGKNAPAVFSVHTMTDKWNNKLRPWQVALLWDKDPRMVEPLFEMLRTIPTTSFGKLNVGDNQPYDGALIGDTMYTHCTQNGYAHALLEVRQDLVETQTQIDEWVELFWPMLEKICTHPHMNEVMFFGSRTADV